MIPTKFLSKMGVYDIQLRGINLKVRVVDNADIVNLGISELKSQFGTTVVGLNFHTSPKYSSLRPSLLELCVGNRCLILQLANINKMPEALKSFLTDKEICFVGIDISNSISKLLSRWYESKCNSGGVELSELVARFSKKPNLSGRGLEELAGVVGVVLKDESARDEVKVDWEAKFFTEEEIKYAVRDVHAYYLIGKKIFG